MTRKTWVHISKCWLLFILPYTVNIIYVGFDSADAKSFFLFPSSLMDGHDRGDSREGGGRLRVYSDCSLIMRSAAGADESANFLLIESPQKQI